MTREEFEQCLKDAIASIPPKFRRAVENLAIVVEDDPSDALLEEMEIEPPDSLFGLYQGTPLTERRFHLLGHRQLSGTILEPRMPLGQQAAATKHVARA